MTQSDADLIRETIAALNRNDLDAVFENVYPDAEIDLSRAIGLDQGVYSVEGFRRVTAEFNDSWASVEYGLDEFIDAGGQTVTPFTTTLRGRDGIEVEAKGAWLWTIRDGKMAGLCLYQETEDALAAARGKP